MVSKDYCIKHSNVQYEMNNIYSFKTNVILAVNSYHFAMLFLVLFSVCVFDLVLIFILCVCVSGLVIPTLF